MGVRFVDDFTRFFNSVSCTGRCLMEKLYLLSLCLHNLTDMIESFHYCSDVLYSDETVR